MNMGKRCAIGVPNTIVLSQMAQTVCHLAEAGTANEDIINGVMTSESMSNEDKAKACMDRLIENFEAGRMSLELYLEAMTNFGVS